MKKFMSFLCVCTATFLFASCTIQINPSAAPTSAQTSTESTSSISSEQSVSDSIPVPSASPAESNSPNSTAFDQSPDSPSNQQSEIWLQRASALTTHLVNDSFPPEATNGFPTPNSLAASDDGNTIYRFIYAQYKYFDEPTDPYYGLFDAKNNIYVNTVFNPETNQNVSSLIAAVPLSKAQLIAYQVFGVENWFYDPDYDIFNQESQCFQFPLEVGPYSSYTAQNLSTEQIDAQTIAVSFDLVGSDHVAKNYGRYQVIYQLLTEQDKQFLRFDHFEAC